MEAMVPKVKAILEAMLPNMEVKDINQVQEHWDEFVTKVAAELEPLWQQSQSQVDKEADTESESESEDEPEVTPEARKREREEWEADQVKRGVPWWPQSVPEKAEDEEWEKI